MQSRPSWDQYFVDIAQVVRTRSTCLRRTVGAILVHEKRILATGYNGAPSGCPHCEEVGCIRAQEGIPSGQRVELCRGLHAEQNALVQAARHGISVKGSTMYTTLEPCILCTKMMINAGITRIVFVESYPDELARKLLAEAGIPSEKFEG